MNQHTEKIRRASRVTNEGSGLEGGGPARVTFKLKFSQNSATMSKATGSSVGRSTCNPTGLIVSK